MRNWILPEHIADMLPAEARWLEAKRRCLLDLFNVHGYQLVMPPLLEYVDSLLTEFDQGIDLKTFKLVDQLTGRQLGLRADMTPQVARIEAHQMHEEGVSRLCYAGSVAHTLPSGLMSSREPFVVGAELFGIADSVADIEALQLLALALQGVGLEQFHVDLGHLGIVRALLQEAQLAPRACQVLFTALQAKDKSAVREVTADLPETLQNAFLALPDLYGDATVLARAKQTLPMLPAISQALDVLQSIVNTLGHRVAFTVDLAEVQVGNYHSGLVFTSYADGWANAIAHGGRYDGVCAQFGRNRPAVGFSLDLRELWRVLPSPAHNVGILAPYVPEDTALQAMIADLRATGQRVVVNLGNAPALLYQAQCQQQLCHQEDGWRITEL